MSAIEYGQINPKGKTAKALNKEFSRYISRLKRKDNKWDFVDDHRSSIISEARRFQEAGKPMLACILYAVAIEHWINGLIFVFGERAKLSSEEIEMVIRETNIRAKMTWLSRLLRLPPINDTHIKLIIHLFELRNSYVHYKWKGRSDELAMKQTVDLEKTLSRVGSAIRYLKEYETRHVFHGVKLKVQRVKLNPNLLLPPKKLVVTDDKSRRLALSFFLNEARPRAC